MLLDATKETLKFLTDLPAHAGRSLGDSPLQFRG